MKLFAIFALLICAVLALAGASPVDGGGGGYLQPALAEPGSAQAPLREARSPSKKSKGHSGAGGGGGGYGGGYGYGR